VEEARAQAIVDGLQARNVMAHVERDGVYQFGVRVVLTGGRQAVWGTNGGEVLEAQVLEDGDLVGFVPQIEGSEHLDAQEVVDLIARTDYETVP
jgi:hypothetical protein